MAHNQEDEITVIPSPQEKATPTLETVERVDSTPPPDDEPREPTDDELAKLRRVPEKIPMRAWYSSLDAVI